MPPSRVLDSHIHLWPATSTTPANHAWMTPGHALAKRHGIQEYLRATTPKPWGFVYVETDRYLPTPIPDIPHEASASQSQTVLETWAKEPLDEIRFLRRIVEATPAEGDGVERASDAALLKVCVLWAPFHLPPALFSGYLQLVRDAAGPALWSRVAGFRYLLQGKSARDVERLVDSEDWLQNVCGLSQGRGGKGWAFDVGVDTHRDGVETLELVCAMIEEVRRRERNAGSARAVRFVLNHLAKPLFPSDPSPRYTAALARFETDQKVYMKLSGAFSEFASPTPSDVETLLSALRPYLYVIFRCFQGRVMFGSDWPVCNVGGPKEEQENWGLWREVAEAWLKEAGAHGADGEESVWWKAGCEAYGLET